MQRTTSWKVGALALAVAAASGSATPAAADVMVDLPNSCADRNALLAIATDAQMNAVKLYYEGYIAGIGDPDRRKCLTKQVLVDESFAVINRTRQLVVGDCLGIDTAAGEALRGLCA